MKRSIVLLTLSVWACATLPVTEEGSPESSSTSTAGTATSTSDQGLVPPGLGTLRQDDFTVSIRSGPLLIKVTPLTERVIRLAAPDTYERLHALSESRRPELGFAGESAELFLVSFFSYEPNATFEPEDVQLIHQGRPFRAVRILPITPGWGVQRLQQQETQTAIYAFDPGIVYDQPITVRYGVQQNDDWSRSIIARLEIERGRVRSRGSSTPPDTSQP